MSQKRREDQNENKALLQQPFSPHNTFFCHICIHALYLSDMHGVYNMSGYAVSRFPCPIRRRPWRLVCVKLCDIFSNLFNINRGKIFDTKFSSLPQNLEKSSGKTCRYPGNKLSLGQIFVKRTSRQKADLGGEICCKIWHHFCSHV